MSLDLFYLIMIKQIKKNNKDIGTKHWLVAFKRPLIFNIF